MEKANQKLTDFCRKLQLTLQINHVESNLYEFKQTNKNLHFPSALSAIML